MKTNLLSLLLLFAAIGAAQAAPTYTDATAPAAGAFAPFTVSNTDLLQTNLSSVSSSGDFTKEGTGGVPILNNGQFSITGAGGNNPQLATGENNASVNFVLDTSVNTLGYNITGIDSYSGWNDSGRDKTLYNVLYSTVGSAAFTPFDTADHDNAGAGGNPSAIRSQFTTNIRGVDAIRIEFPAGQENGHAGYGEFDVFGTAAVQVTSAQIGAGSGIGGANNLDGNDPGQRLNVDEVNSQALAAGTYNVDDISFNVDAGNGTGTVIAFLAKLTGANTYETLWVSPTETPAATGIVTTNYLAGTQQFTLGSPTTVFAGIYQDGIARIFYNDDATLTDHDGGGVIVPNSVGQAIDNFSNPNLNNRTYKFEIDVSPVPEPTSFGLASFAIMAVAGVARRRRSRV